MNDNTPPTAGLSTVTAWHNIATDDTGRPIGIVDGYRPGHALVPVARWFVPASTPSADVLNETFALLNVGHEPDFGTVDPRAVRYRARYNRSLSVGDVIQLGKTWSAIASVGFTAITAPEFFAIDALRQGSVSLDAGVPPVGPLASRFDHRDLEDLLRTAVALYDNWPLFPPRGLRDWQYALLERLSRACKESSADTGEHPA